MAMERFVLLLPCLPIRTLNGPQPTYHNAKGKRETNQEVELGNA